MNSDIQISNILKKSGRDELGGGGELECNMTGRYPFLRICTICLGKKFAFQCAVWELQLLISSRKQ